MEVKWHYLELKTAKNWGIVPSKWRLLNKEDKAQMMAFDRIENLVDKWYSYQTELKIEREKQKDGIFKSGRNR